MKRSFDSTVPVLVAGAGPSGMTAALELTRFGIPVRIIDKAQVPATTSRAIGLQPRTLELLAMRGLADRLLAVGNPARCGSIYAGGRRVHRIDFSPLRCAYPYTLFISQAATERVLRDRLEQLGVVIERGVELVSCTQDESCVTAVLRSRDVLGECSASYLIDAEGAHSVVRGALGLTFEGKTRDQSYWLGDLVVDSDLSDHEYYLFTSAHGFLGMFPMGDRRFRLIADHPLSEASGGTPTLDECQSIYDQRAPIAARLHDLTWSSTFRINSRMVPSLRAGRVFLGGDAAHVHSPAGAQGMNTGIQDMINLAWKLALRLGGEAADGLLDTYEAERIPVIRNVLQRTEVMTDATGAESTVFGASPGGAPAAGGPALPQAYGVEHISQLAVTYRGSPLSEDHGPPHDVVAGDRVPDEIVRLVASSAPENGDRVGTSVRVLDLLDPSRVALVLAHALPDASVGALEGSLRALVDANPRLRFHRIALGSAAPGAPCVYAIRPDGYIGFRGTPSDEGRLRAYLDRWLGEHTAARA